MYVRLHHKKHGILIQFSRSSGVFCFYSAGVLMFRVKLKRFDGEMWKKLI